MTLSSFCEKQKTGNKTQNALLPVMVFVFVNKYDLAYSKDATLPLGNRESSDNKYTPHTVAMITPPTETYLNSICAGGVINSHRCQVLFRV